MKSTIILLAACMVLTFSLIGCGGGGSSSTTDTLPTTSSSPSPSPKSSPQPSPSGQFSSLAINPLADLGLAAGDNVCFSVKSYNNFSESDFSKAVCGKIKDDNKLTLAWNKNTENVNGYYVYFGTDKNNATNFLADVIES